MIAVSRARQPCPGYHAYTVKIRFTHLLASVALAALAPGLAFSASATSTDRLIVKWRDAGSA